MKSDFTRSGRMRMIARCSSGWRYGYLSSPRYFLASASMWASAPWWVLDHPPADADVVVPVVLPVDREPGSVVAADVVDLLASLGGVDEDVVPVERDPDRRGVREPVLLLGDGRAGRWRRPGARARRPPLERPPPHGR